MRYEIKMPSIALKRRGRSLEELLVDRLLLLYMLKDLNEQKVRVYETALQKLVFLAEWKMLSKRIKGFNYNFIRLDFGPYCRDLKRDLMALIDRGLVRDAERGYILTEEGVKLLERLEELLKRNKDVLDIIKSVNKRYGHLNLIELLTHIYKLPRPLKGPKVPIIDVKFRSYLLRRLDARRAKRRINVRPNELRLLSVFMNPEVEELMSREVEGREALIFRFRGEESYTAIVPSLPGCLTQGDGLKQLMENLKEAMECYEAKES